MEYNKQVYLKIMKGEFILYHVYDDVLVERCPVLSREVADLDDGLWIVRVDVEYGSVDNATDVRAVRRRSTVTRIGGEANLQDESCIVIVF